MENNTFQGFESTERMLAVSLFKFRGITDFRIENEGNCSRTDGEFRIEGSPVTRRFEIKVRQCSQDCYPDHILEVEKLKELIKYYKQGYKVFYFNFFLESPGKFSFIGYNISARLDSWKKRGIRIPDIWELMILPRHTAVGHKEYIYKPVVRLTRNRAADVIIGEVPIYDGYVSDTTLTSIPTTNSDTTTEPEYTETKNS